MNRDDSHASSSATLPFSQYTVELADRAASTEGVRGLVLLGSATQAAASRRDEWSDHDFYILFLPGAEAELRRHLPFLPAQERIVLTAREAADGFAVLYDDGHILEFGAGTLDEFTTTKFGEHDILVGDDQTVRWASDAAERGASFTPESATDAAGLTLIKLLIGFGRATRGEVLSGSAFVRGHAVTYLTLAIRRRWDAAAGAADPFDPVRRFEEDFPEVAASIAAALETPVVDAARQLLAILRSELEPGWADFPSAAADIVARRIVTD